MIEVHAEFPQREVIQANAVVDNEEKTISEVIISAKPEITGVTASVDNETGTPYVDITETGTGTEFSFDLAFHNLKGDKGEQGEQGEPGQDGQDGTDGTDGADGQAATVTVGITTTGAAGTNASVVNSGTSSAAVFDFVIPRGDKGDKGDKGDTGSQGPQGVQGEQGPQGIQGPKGETGATGQDGYSPTANVTQSGDITTITITDKNGTTTESIDLSDFGKVKSVNNTQPDANGNVTLTIPTVNDGILTITQNGTSKGTFSANQSTNNTIALTDTTYNAFTGADGTNAGSSGLVPAPSATDNDKYLKGDGTWASVSGGSSTDVQINGTSITSGGVANIVTNTAYNASSNKIATMSDLPTGFANIDLSNLSATGEAHFLKSINSTDVINALGYTPENQANKVTSFSSSSTDTQYPSAKLLYDQLLLKQNTSTAVTHTANTAVGSSTTPVYINSSGVATSTGLSIASSRFDGAVVYKYSKHDMTTTVGTKTISLSSYLPSGSSSYLVLMTAYANTNNSTPSVVDVSGNSSMTALTILRAGSNGRYQQNSVWLPVNSSKTITVTVSNSAISNTLLIELYAYRRIGTNS